MEVIIVFMAVAIVFLLYFLFQNKTRAQSKYRARLKRVCPLCGSRLGDDDCVIGEYTNIDGKKKVYIYGCNYCLKGHKHGKKISL